MSEKSSGGFFSNIRQNIEQYIESRLRLMQLSTLEKMANLAGVAAFLAISCSIFGLTLLSISLMAGFYFAQIFDSYFTGFAIVAGFYGVLLFLLLLTRKKIANFFSNQFIKIIFKNTPSSTHAENEKS